MKQIVVMPGGFHPFHAGHASLYQSALEAFPDADVYVAATNDQKKRPFPFAIKEKLAKVAGVAPGHFVQVKSPFKAEEITKNYDPNEDVLIFVRSEKDKTEQPKPGGTKKDGSPAYFQPYTGKDLQPFSKHAYIAYLPTIEFGPGITSASEIRELWPRLNDKRKTAMVMSLYPAAQKNPKLAANIVGMLDQVMGGQVNEVLNTKPNKTNKSTWSEQTEDLVQLNFVASNGLPYNLSITALYMSPDEIQDSVPEEIPNEVAERGRFVEFFQESKPGAGYGKQGIEGTGAAAEVLAIVYNGLNQYVKKYKPTFLMFQAAEPSRRRLYSALVKKILQTMPNWKYTENDGIFFVYDTRYIKQGMKEGFGIPMPGTYEQEQLSEYKTKVLDKPKTTNVYYKPRHGNKTYLIGKDVPGEHIDKFINLVKHKYADLRNAGKDEIFWNVEVKEEVSLDAITDAAAYIPNAINDYLQKAIAVYGQEAKESAQMVKLLPLMYAGKATPDQLKFIKDQFADIGNILGKQLKTLGTGSVTGPIADAISDSPVAQKIIDKTLDSLADIPEEKGLSKAENYFKNKFGFSLVGKVANLLKFETSSDVQYKQQQKADQAEINKQQATPQSQAVNKQVNTMRRQQHYAYEDVAKGKMKPMHVTGKEKPGAVETLEKALVKAKDRGIKLDYDKIDKMMQLICKEHNLTGDKLHNDFVKKHHMIPDNWIKKHSDVTESVDYLEEK